MVMEEAGIAAEEEEGVSSLSSSSSSSSSSTSRSEESGGTPLQRMERQLEKAIETEDYERAAQLRDKIEQLKQEEN
jgi:hypothetical protein